MKTRLITGLIVAFLVVWLIFRGPLSLITGVILLCAVLSYHEFDRLFFTATDGNPWVRQLRMGLMIAFSVIAIAQGSTLAWAAVWIAMVALTVRHVLLSDRKNRFEESVAAYSLEVMGYFYVLGLFGFILPIVQIGYEGRLWLLFLFLLVFIGDSAAYFAGMKWGQHRLAPNISPKKSIEGAVAAIISSLLVGIAFIHWKTEISILSPTGLQILLLCPIVSVLAQMGDLFESMLKRSRTIKDSGSLLPGHGGLLDRVDGLFLSTPVFYFYLKFILQVLP